ncbi:glucan 1,3-beta-glucosidase, partial [Tremellales sp. Uapishka_1]
MSAKTSKAVADPDYTSIPTHGPSSPDPYANLAGPNDSGDYLGRRGSAYLPAPSILTRDSTYGSLPGTPPLGENDHRASWASGAPLAGAAGLAGVRQGARANASRGQSSLAHSNLGWNNTDHATAADDDQEQGHITPAAAGLGAYAGAAGLSEKSPRWAGARDPSPKRSRKWLWAILAAAVLAVIALAVGLGVGLTKGKSSSKSGIAANDNSGAASTKAASGTQSSSPSSTSSAAPTPTSGTMGSLITLEDGSTFTYNNTFGGTWVYDANNPFNNDAQCNSWTPSLNQNWTWGTDKIFGVNIGGWLNTEPFIVPALYEKYLNTGVNNNQTAYDEYTLSQNMGSNMTAALTEHYETFYTEQDFADIAAAGLNWVRIPLPHWAIETWPEEPYLERVAWTYFLKAIQWCRKYGLRINLDFHTMPGSQNGWNHSGHQGDINWMNGVMGTANAQRALDYIRTLAEFISQPEYSNVIQMFGFINEPNAGAVGMGAVGSFYYEAYKIIREVTGIGAGNGPMLSIHDGFLGVNKWYGFLPGADRLALDQHSYLVFGDQVTGSAASIAQQPCNYWAVSTNTSSEQWGVNVAGEWSSAQNDCGLWVNNVGQGSRYDGTYLPSYAGKGIGSCADWNDYRTWNASQKQNVMDFTIASMDALQNYFFWTWKIGPSTGDLERVNPFWDYSLGRANGWVPTDPRVAVGHCAALGVDSNEFDGTFSSAWMTGGVGANTIAADQSSSYPWPVTTMSPSYNAAQLASLPQYTQTGTPITMPALTYTSPGSSQTIGAGNGWANLNVNQQNYAAVSGCSYPPEYFAASIAIPTSACGAGSTPSVLKRDSKPAAHPQPTTPPSPRR